MKRRILAHFLIALLLTSSACAQQPVYEKHQFYFFGTFDTVITMIGFTQSADEFNTYAKLAEAEMNRYHEIFDQYHPYDGVNNLYYLNQNAPTGAVPAEKELIELLVQIKNWQDAYSAGTNPAMGSVLGLWHDARTDGAAGFLVILFADHLTYIHGDAH